MKTRIPSIFACAILSLTSHAQGVLVVGSEAGGTPEFVDVQAALEVASEGAIILVRNGEYPGFVVDGQSVVITNDLQADLFGTAVFDSPIVVRNIGANQSVTLNGLSSVGGEPLVCEDNSGAIFLQSCFLVANTGQGNGPVIRDSESVTIMQSTIRGGNDSTILPCFPFCDPESSSGFGLRAVRSNVQIYSSTLRGGNSPSALIAGGPGLAVVDSQVLASGSTISGGLGYQAVPSSPFGDCQSGGPGGNAVLLISGNPVLRTYDSDLIPGIGGQLAEAPCVNGPDGVALDIVDGSTSVNAGPVRSFFAQAPVQEGEVLHESYSGQPGDLVLLLISASSIPAVELDGIDLPFHLGGNLFVQNRGFIPASGIKTKDLPISDLGAGLDGFSIYAQPVFVDLVNQSTDLAPMRSLLFLDGSY